MFLSRYMFLIFSQSGEGYYRFYLVPGPQRYIFTYHNEK